MLSKATKMFQISPNIERLLQEYFYGKNVEGLTKTINFFPEVYKFYICLKGYPTLFRI
jgi:hypothetical protein